MLVLIISLIILGLILLIVEAILIPGFGIAGILGILSIIASCFIGFSSYGAVIGGLIVLINIILVIITCYLTLRSNTWKKVTLNTSIDSKADIYQTTDTIEVGDIGEAITRLTPHGKGLFNGTVADVFAQDSVIECGSTIEVKEIDKNKIIVIIK